MKVLVLTNSDLGVKNAVGIRAFYISKILQEKKALCKIICRDYNRELKELRKFIIKPIPLGNLFPKIITGISIYLIKSISEYWVYLINRTIFEFFSKKYLKNLDFNIVHSFDFTPNLYKQIKTKNSNVKIVKDIQIAWPNVLENAKEDEFVKREKAKGLWTPKDRLKIIKKYIDYFVVSSDFVKNSLVREGIKEENIFIIPIGVDIKKFKPIKRKDNKIFKVAFAGNVCNKKGIPYLIQAWKELNLKDAELNLYGRVYPEIKKYLKDNNRYNIKIHGFVDLTKELPKNHIFVFPSLLEGPTKVNYEALACGLPVITTYNTGSIVRDDKEGFIIPIQNTKAIKEKILYFYNNPSEIVRMGNNARKLAEKYTWKRYGEEIFKIYKKIIS